MQQILKMHLILLQAKEEEATFVKIDELIKKITFFDRFIFQVRVLFVEAETRAGVVDFIVYLKHRFHKKFRWRNLLE